MYSLFLLPYSLPHLNSSKRISSHNTAETAPLSLLILFLISLNSSSMCLVKNLMLLILFCDKKSFCKLLLSFDPMKILSSIFTSSSLASPYLVSFFDSSFVSFHVGVPWDLSLALCSSHLHYLGAI